MPVDFLTTEQKNSYGQFNGEPNDVQLARYFHLDEADLAFITQRRGEHNRFGVALQLGCVRFLGTFLIDLNQIPTNTQWFVARQLNITNIGILSDYSQRETTRREHTALIRNQLKTVPRLSNIYRIRYATAVGVLFQIENLINDTKSLTCQISHTRLLNIKSLKASAHGVVINTKRSFQSMCPMFKWGQIYIA